MSLATGLELEGGLGTHAAAAPEARRTGALTLGLFSAPAIPLAALGLPLVVYLPEFYANYVGIKLATVGLIFMLVRLVDIGFDPVLGMVMDRTRTRLGRFPPWMVASIPVLMIASYLVFMPPQGASALYLSGGLLLLYLGFSMAVVSHFAWAAVLADGYHARSRIYGWIQAFTIGGMVLVLFLPPIGTKIYPGNEAVGVASMGWFIITLTPITIALCAWRAKEPPRSAIPAAEQATGRLADYARLVRQPALARLLACCLLLALAPGITGALFLFFFRIRGFTTGQANLLLLIYFLGGLAGAPVWTRLARRFGKHKAMLSACGYYALLQGSSLTFPHGNMALGIPYIFFAGVAFSASLILLRAMVADSCDEARLHMKVDCTGMIYALYNSTAKVGAAVAVGITFPLLQLVGFVAKAGAHNTSGAILGLELIFTIFPVVFVLLGGLAIWGYKLDEVRHGEIRAALAERDALPA